MRVGLDVTEDRLPRPVEAAAYFVCAEAIANAAKHAPASTVAVTVAAAARGVAIAVVDDGPGGADSARGSGLRGLADRVEALGGTLRVESLPGHGHAAHRRDPALSRRWPWDSDPAPRALEAVGETRTVASTNALLVQDATITRWRSLGDRAATSVSGRRRSRS